ncbi:hypothetical protein BCR36DRAFT_585213 [Piromyces finnis]|uniref:Peptidase C14 caspase domain-containing protein n=1 Tax=Piromyces finnis TaxID=1754191 RepID=A0A1Y1V3J7_9FUNG|nr:hypothetical protein BCR36DRAFT_585213 [Piromyces finnis]|eukprot:ORX46395.1 hypothetical protein BCR36DRAFT_585213 [Piromyces finnis]
MSTITTEAPYKEVIKTTTKIVNGQVIKETKRYKIKVNTDNSTSKLTNHIHNQIKSQEVWNNDVEKFYNEREGDKFTRSDCSGNKKALYIGINYIGGKSPLNGCINDVKNISQLVAKKFGITQAIILTDDQSDERKKPTYQNIINGMKWLTKDAKAGDSLFFHYSGHGGTAKDKDNDEVDGFDETILPCDYLTNGQILDDDIYENLVAPLPRGCRLTAIFDSCHSGTVMDLPYTYQCQGKVEVIENDVRKEIFKKTSNVIDSINSGNKDRIADSLKSIFDGSLRKAASNGVDPEVLKQRQNLADVIQFSGCRDNQTSADAKIGNVATGAMSLAIITLLNEEKEYTYTEMLANIKQIMAEKKFTQIPQLSTSRPLNMNEKFSM